MQGDRSLWCEQMFLVLGVVWLQVGFQFLELCGSKKVIDLLLNHSNGLMEDGCGCWNFAVGVWHRMLSNKVELLGQN